MLRPCGDCNKCCSGNLIGTSYGNSFGPGRPCIFLVSECCTIYKDRPESCKKYQCAWTQNILSEQFRPDKCGIMVSVQNDQQKQYFKVVQCAPIVDDTVLEELLKFCNNNNTYFELNGTRYPEL